MGTKILKNIVKLQRSLFQHFDLTRKFHELKINYIFSKSVEILNFTENFKTFAKIDKILLEFTSRLIVIVNLA